MPRIIIFIYELFQTPILRRNKLQQTGNFRTLYGLRALRHSNRILGLTHQVLLAEVVAPSVRLRGTERGVQPLDAQGKAGDGFGTSKKVLDEGVAERSGQVNALQAGELVVRVGEQVQAGVL